MSSQADEVVDQSIRPGRVRRVVTGHDVEGRSVVLSDADAANVFRSETVAGLGSAVAWQTPPEGARNEGTDDAAAAGVDIAMYPAPGGTIFRIADFPPDREYQADHDAAGMFDEIGGPHAQVADGRDGERHFWFHKTDSLDYAVVLEGEIWMILDHEECLLRAGDVVVQRGTGHAWANRSDVACRVAFILIGTPPVGAEASGNHGR